MENDTPEQTTSAEDIATGLLYPEEGQPQSPEPETEDQQDGEIEEGQEAPDETDESEDAGEEADNESEDEDEQPGQADSAPADDQVVKWQTANGETFEAPLSELKAGYMRSADYTQKTQALAEDRKAAEQALQSKVQEAERYTEELGRLATIGEQVKNYETWLAQAAQRGEDPQVIAQVQAQYVLLRQQHEDARGALLQKRQQLMQQAEQQRSQEFQQATQAALEHLGKVIPKFDAATHIPALREYGLKSGFTADELAQTSDKRHFEVLWKASQWDALQAKKPEAVARAKAAPPKTTKPGHSAPPPSAVDRAAKQFKAKKDAHSFAALLAATNSV